MIVCNDVIPRGMARNCHTDHRMRRHGLIAAKFLVSATLFYFAARGLNFAAASERLARIEPGWTVLAVSLAFAQIALLAIRWRQVTTACGAPLPLQHAVQFSVVAAFFSQVLPSTIGGDAARILLHARHSAGWRVATYSVLLDRFFGVVVLASLVAAGLYWSLRLIVDPVGRMALVTIGIGSLVASAGFLAFGAWPVLARWKLTRFITDLATLARFILSSRQNAAMIVPVSLAIHVLTVAMAWSLAKAVSAQLDFFQAFILILPVMLVATVPVSVAGWGVRETALVLAFGYAGLPESDGLIVSVLLGMVMFVVGLAGGLVWLASSLSLHAEELLDDALTANQAPLPGTARDAKHHGSDDTNR